MAELATGLENNIQGKEATLEELDGSYPDAEEGRLTVAIIQAAREVRERNFAYMQQGIVGAAYLLAPLSI